MDIKTRHNLADAYMSAWHAVKGSNNRLVVNPEPLGWFEIINAGTTRRVRAAGLVSSLAALTAQLERATHE